MHAKVLVIAEIGINHNGDLRIAKQLIDGAKMAGCDAVKFQKRTIDLVYTTEFLESLRESPWGTTQRAQKEGLEFGKNEYDVIDAYCRDKGIAWFASAWDVEAQRFLSQYDLEYNKVASAMLANEDFLLEVAGEGKYTFVSTGMSTMEEVARAVDLFRKYNCPFELLHTNSTYPMKNEDANLLMIPTLANTFECKVGYSGHEIGRVVSTCAVALGATSLERHITLDRAMYGSDQAASIEIDDLYRLVKDVRTVEKALGTGEKVMTEAELAVRKKLRGN